MKTPTSPSEPSHTELFGLDPQGRRTSRTGQGGRPRLGKGWRRRPDGRFERVVGDMPAWYAPMCARWSRAVWRHQISAGEATTALNAWHAIAMRQSLTQAAPGAATVPHERRPWDRPER